MQLGDSSEWVKVFDPRDCVLFTAGDDDLSVGDDVRIDLAIGSEGPRIILRGKVLSNQPAGWAVAISNEDREKINYLNGFVRGGLLDLRERRRLPLRLPVTYGAVEGPRNTYTRDINEEGLFVVTEQPLPEDTEVHLQLKVPDVVDVVQLAGVVSHTVVVEDEDVPGMGILIQFSGDDAARSFEELIDNLEERFLTGNLPDEVLS